jgi:hypothetical protein
MGLQQGFSLQEFFAYGDIIVGEAESEKLLSAPDMTEFDLLLFIAPGPVEDGRSPMRTFTRSSKLRLSA